MQQYTGLIGIVALLVIAALFSKARRRINARIVIGGLLLQFAIAGLLLKVPGAVYVFDRFARGVTKVISFADAGTEFIFGKAADAGGPWGFVFAIKVLPVIIFFASFMAVLYHFGIMQRVVAGFAWVMRRTMGVTGAESLSAAANIFVGQTEAPLCIRPYLATMTRSQIMAVMTGGFATIAGSVMAAYVLQLGGDDPAARTLFAKHLITASVISAPAGFVFAKVMLPEIQEPREETVKSLLEEERTTSNVVDAAATGASDGLRLALNVAAMLVAFVSLIALLNWPLTALSEWEPVAAWRAEHGLPVFSFQNILGTILMPLGWCMGAPWAESRAMGSLLGTQVIATEFVAYLNLADLKNAGTMSPRTAQIATYALCGFANLPSIAIQIGGLSALAPGRRVDFVKIGPRAMVAGAFACWTTACVASVFIPV
ncbi:Putative nucleoside permease NupX [Phycisphaerales bacterium]|nr:Putative nucleoside permease NupX [Phycisphaerales bacterium]